MGYQIRGRMRAEMGDWKHSMDGVLAGNGEYLDRVVCHPCTVT